MRNKMFSGEKINFTEVCDHVSILKVAVLVMMLIIARMFSPIEINAVSTCCVLFELLSDL